MQFTHTDLKDAFIVDIEPREDDRGFFARTYCEKEFRDHTSYSPPVQMNLSYNKKAGTLRGMHFQRPPHEETKLVRCVRGAIYDVIVDVRPDSLTRFEWVGAELTAENRRALFVPKGFAHGFITLADDTEVMYQVSEFYKPDTEGGIRYDDPRIGIHWPHEVKVISEKDASWPYLRDEVMA